MARFSRSTDVLVMMDGLMAALFMWGPGIVVPPNTSLSPPSTCIAQAPVYHGIALLQAIMVGLLVASAALCGLVKLELAVSGGDTLTRMHPYARRYLRGCMLVAVLLSGVCLGLGLHIFVYVLEAKVSLFSCLSVGARVSFVTSYVVTGVVCTYVFARFVWVVVFYD